MRNSFLYTLLSVSFLCASISVCAQDATVKRIAKRLVDGNYTEAFTVLATDTTIRDGKYELYYRKRTIESGNYKEGKKIGTWTYKNYDNNVELMYNYTLGQPVYILPHVGKEYDQNNYPCMFLGSPIIPYFFVMSRIYYPLAEQDRKGGGKVVLALNINSVGRVTGYRIKESTSINFTQIVRRAADQIPKDKWLWVPALRSGKNVADEYVITVVFDNGL